MANPAYGGTAGHAGLPGQEAEADVAEAKPKAPVKRMAAGEVWVDETLADWPEDDFRLFVGNLGNDATDQLLASAFSKYPSFQKAHVVRDKQLNKPRGYGFVSFKEPWDMTKAMREMENKFVGSRPVKLKRSTWKDRNFDKSKARELKTYGRADKPQKKRFKPVKWP